MALLLEGLCHYFPNVPLNLVNHVNCVPETISSIGWVYYSHGKLHALRFEQNSWCELWRWAGRREGRHSVLVIEKKNVNGVSKLGWTLKHLGTLRLWIGDWRVEPRHHVKTQQTKDKKSLTPMPLFTEKLILRIWNLPGWESFNFGSRDLEMSSFHCFWLKSLTFTATAPRGTELKAPINEEKEMLRMIWAREEKQK